MFILFYPEFHVAILIDALEGCVGTLYLDVTVLDEDGPYGARVVGEQLWRYGESEKLRVG